MFWPILVSLVILAIAYTLYRMMPEIIDGEMSMLWVTGAFLLIYIGAAVYLSYSIPAFGRSTAPTQTENGYEVITVEDVISR